MTEVKSGPVQKDLNPTTENDWHEIIPEIRYVERMTDGYPEHVTDAVVMATDKPSELYYLLKY